MLDISRLLSSIQSQYKYEVVRKQQTLVEILHLEREKRQKSIQETVIVIF